MSFRLIPFGERVDEERGLNVNFDPATSASYNSKLMNILLYDKFKFIKHRHLYNSCPIIPTQTNMLNTIWLRQRRIFVYTDYSCPITRTQRNMLNTI